MSLILIMTISYAFFYLIPTSHSVHSIPHQDNSLNFTMEHHLSERQCNLTIVKTHYSLCNNYRRVDCYRHCDRKEFIEGYLTKINGLFEFCSTNQTYINDTFNQQHQICDFECFHYPETDIDCVSGTNTFWIFVFLMCIGTIGFNVTNSISDAICFDVLGNFSCLNSTCLTY